MVEYQGEKMSKSLGNLVLVSNALKSYDPDTIRLYLFSHHYREAWEYQDDEVDEWARLSQDLREAVNFTSYGIDEEVDVSQEEARFRAAMDDDLNTGEAIEALRDMSTAILEAAEEDDIRDAQRRLAHLGSTLGLALNDGA
jgi:L-cysteine:1D-myo-inositol 2-amino-2-deoxy-alpha-D-glucopyranoside ligase